MAMFFAQPYDISASGFYFEDEQSYSEKITSTVNDFGQTVEEFEIQFIDGDGIDCALARAWGINQVNILRFMEVIDEWDEDEKIRFILAVGECGYDFEHDKVDPNAYDLDIYETESLKELAEQFVDEGLYGPIPDSLTFYIDYEAIARDLAVDFTETNIAGRRLIYACR